MRKGSAPEVVVSEQHEQIRTELSLYAGGGLFGAGLGGLQRWFFKWWKVSIPRCFQSQATKMASKGTQLRSIWGVQDPSSGKDIATFALNLWAFVAYRT